MPIVPGVFLNRVGVGLCLSPPPFKLRGDVGVTALGGKLDVNGRFIYTDATDTSPWNAEVGGNVKFDGTQLGDATVGFNAWGDVNFDVNADIALGEVASIKGNVGGWIEPRNSTFNIAGTVQGCIAGLRCATASGLVSSSGIAGCLDLGTITLDLPDKVVEGPFGFGSIRIITRKATYVLKSGVGYKYPTSVVKSGVTYKEAGRASLLGNSCDFSPYAATRSPAATARNVFSLVAGRGLSEQVGRGTRAVTLRIHGTKGSPKVVLRGPNGGDDQLTHHRDRHPAQGSLRPRGERVGRHDERAADEAGRRHLAGRGGTGRRVHPDARGPLELPGAAGPLRAGAQHPQWPRGRGGVRRAGRRDGAPR